MYWQLPHSQSPEVRALVHEGLDVIVTPSPSPTPASPAPTTSASPDQGIAMIVTVKAFSSTHYRLDNAGIEQIAGKPTYHLKLTAKDGDTSTYPLTDMYVDQATHLVRRVVLGGGQRGFFQAGGGSSTFDFSNVGKYWLVTHISIEIGGHMLLISKHASLDYTLSGIAAVLGSGIPATVSKLSWENSRWHGPFGAALRSGLCFPSSVRSVCIRPVLTTVFDASEHKRQHEKANCADTERYPPTPGGRKEEACEAKAADNPECAQTWGNEEPNRSKCEYCRHENSDDLASHAR